MIKDSNSEGRFTESRERWESGRWTRGEWTYEGGQMRECIAKKPTGAVPVINAARMMVRVNERIMFVIINLGGTAGYKSCPIWDKAFFITICFPKRSVGMLINKVKRWRW